MAETAYASPGGHVRQSVQWPQTTAARRTSSRSKIQRGRQSSTFFESQQLWSAETIVPSFGDGLLGCVASRTTTTSSILRRYTLHAIRPSDAAFIYAKSRSSRRRIFRSETATISRSIASQQRFPPDKPQCRNADPIIRHLSGPSFSLSTGDAPTDKLATARSEILLEHARPKPANLTIYL